MNVGKVNQVGSGRGRGTGTPCPAEPGDYTKKPPDTRGRKNSPGGGGTDPDVWGYLSYHAQWEDLRFEGSDVARWAGDHNSQRLSRGPEDVSSHSYVPIGPCALASARLPLHLLKLLVTSPRISGPAIH